MHKIVMVLVVLTAVLISSDAFASVNDDQVTSQKIKEADGTSNQDTNSGSGVKTGHIQDGAVTDSKIGGTISQSKITGLESALAGKSDITHDHDILYQQKYGKVAVVAQSGGDYTSPVAAMNALVTWCGTPSVTNRCLLKIQPGVYDLAGGSLQTQSYVDVEGSGENATVVKSSALTVQLSDNAEVRFLTVESTGGVPNSNAIYITGSGRLSHVSASAAGGTAYSIAVNVQYGSPVLSDIIIDLHGNGPQWGIVTGQFSGTTTVKNTIISVSGGGVNYGMGLNGGSTVLSNISITVTAGIGILDTGATVTIANSAITADMTGIAAEGGPTTIQFSTIKGGMTSFAAASYVDARLAATQFNGPFSPTSNCKCFNIYDANFQPLTCQ